MKKNDVESNLIAMLVGVVVLVLGMIWTGALTTRIATLEQNLGKMTEAIHIEHVNSNLQRILKLEFHHKDPKTADDEDE